MKCCTKAANKNACLPPCSNKNCNLQMIGQVLAFLVLHLPSVTMLMYSLSKFLSSLLFYFVPSDNSMQPNKLDTVLETLSCSDI